MPHRCQAILHKSNRTVFPVAVDEYCGAMSLMEQ